MKAKTIQIVNDILAIVWEDGHESYFDFETLRRACPCAMCKGEANVMVEYKLGRGDLRSAHVRGLETGAQRRLILPPSAR
jgi:DUF971 family protein